MLANRKIKFVELSPKEPFLYSMLERPVKFRSKEGFHYGFGWCGGPCRWGTSEKLRAIKIFKKSLGEPTIDYVGIAADEPTRFNKASQEGKTLPLVQWGMTEKDCLQYCYDRGFHWVEKAANAGTAVVRVWLVCHQVDLV